jgi:hypothetical protein
MTVLRSDCHRVAHRKPNSALSINDLRRIIAFAKQGQSKICKVLASR